MTANVHHLITFTVNMDRSLLLYQDILGLDLKWRLPEVGGQKMSAVFGMQEMKAEMAYLSSPNNGVAVELVRMIHTDVDDAANARSDGTGLSLRVENLDAVYGKLGEHDWLPFTEPVKMLSPEGESIRMFCFRSDEGLLIELFGVA